jgi:hypothetical protein
MGKQGRGNGGAASLFGRGVEAAGISMAREAGRGGSCGTTGHVSRKKNGAAASGSGNTSSIRPLQITDEVAAQDC